MAKPGLSRNAVLAYAIAAAVIVVDQVSKFWVLNGLMLPLRGTVQAFGPLHLTMVWNTGFSFGLLRDGAEIGRWALAAFSAIIAVVLIRWALTVERRLLATAVGLVIGGAIGNLIDRVRLAAVVDFIDVSRLLPFFPWIFNVADSGISIGVMLLLLDTVLNERKSATPRA
jgi:signal peptidase II